LGITESPDHIVLCDLADAGFEFFDSWIETAGQKQKTETTKPCRAPE
jgi:hypothetical protein